VGWTLAEHNGDGRRELADSALASYRALLAPHWPKVQGHLHAERSARARVFLEHGVEGLLATLHPEIRWNSPVLEVGMCGDAEIHLRGRGLSLVPSLFVGLITTRRDGGAVLHTLTSLGANLLNGGIE
jgi:hypothetical protein